MTAQVIYDLSAREGYFSHFALKEAAGTERSETCNFLDAIVGEVCSKQMVFRLDVEIPGLLDSSKQHLEMHAHCDATRTTTHKNYSRRVSA